MRQLEPSELPDAGWRVDEGGQGDEMLDSRGDSEYACCLVCCGEGNVEAACTGLGWCGQSSESESQRRIIVTVSCTEGCRKGAPCQGGRLGGCSTLVPIVSTLLHLLGAIPPLPHSQLGHFPCCNGHGDLVIRQSSASFPSSLLGLRGPHPKTRLHGVHAGRQGPHSKLGPHG